MKSLFMLIIALQCKVLFAQNFIVTPIIENGSPQERINIVYLGDGYLANQMDDFISDVNTINEALFSQSPYKEYIDYFNVYAIETPSNVQGAALDPNQPIDNYFGSTFNYASIQRLLVPINSALALTVLANNFPNYDQVIMVVNSETYGGSGGQIATTSVHDDAPEIAIHEIGHSFVSLSDEYWAGEIYAKETPNMTKDNNSNTVKWSLWWGDFGVGAYTHSGNPTWFKPHQNCKMQFLGSPFCSVCKQATIERIHDLTNPIISIFPDSGTISAEPNISFNIELILPVPNTLRVTWSLNGKVFAKNAQNVNLLQDSLDMGLNSFSVIVEDTTAMLRAGNDYTGHIYSIEWEVNNLTTGIGINGIVKSSSKISVFPNPVTERLMISVEEGNDWSAEIINAQGELFRKVSSIDVTDGIELSGLAPGIYFMNIKLGSSVFTEKIIKIE